MRKISMVLILTYVLATVLSACSTTPPEVSSGDTPPTVSSSSTSETGSTTESSFTTKNTTTTTKEKASATKGTSSGTITTSATATVSTTSSTRRTVVTYGPTGLEFSDLAAYKEKLLTFNSKDTLKKAFIDANAREFGERFFPMLLEDHFFLLPNIPEKNSTTITEIQFYSDGCTLFIIESVSGKPILLTINHRITTPVEIRDSQEIKNNRGITLVKYDTLWDTNDIRVLYEWDEEGYPCRIVGLKDCEQEVEAFAKALTFEKVAIK